MFDKVLLNNTFRLRFINRYADLINTMFQPLNFNTEVSETLAMMSGTMPHHIDRWNSPETYSSWLNAISNLTSYNASRVNTARTHLKNSFGLPADYNCTLDVFPPPAGAVRVNTITPGPLPWQGVYFEECPIELEAIATEGWMFDSWDNNQHILAGDMNADTRITSVPLFTNDLFRARFVPCPEDATATIVSNGGLLSVSLENIPYADSIAWFLEDGFVGAGSEWAPNVDGSFTAEVFFDGCSAISPSFEAGAVDIELLQPDNAFKLWPNPANESFTFQMPTPRPFRVFNAMGQAVWESLPSSGMNPDKTIVQVPTNEWPEGTYVVRSGPNAFKLVVQR
jgi:hypothetical protein